MNYALIGLGFISQKHIDAINNTGGKLLMACDIDSNKWGKLDTDVEFFTDWHLMFRNIEFKNVDIVSICTPNYLHFEMINAARFMEKTAICEKPLVLNPEQIRVLDDKVNVVMQLRYSSLLSSNIFDSIKKEGNDVELNINVHRGEWYFNTWKNDKSKSGGLLMNIGIHYFDLLQLLFGDFTSLLSAVNTEKSAKGILHNSRSEVRWNINLDIPMDNQRRQLVVNGEKFNLSAGFDNLHTIVYKDIINGGGIKPSEAYKSIWLTRKLQELGEEFL